MTGAGGESGAQNYRQRTPWAGRRNRRCAGYFPRAAPILHTQKYCYALPEFALKIKRVWRRCQRGARKYDRPTVVCLTAAPTPRTDVAEELLNQLDDVRQSNVITH